MVLSPADDVCKPCDGATGANGVTALADDLDLLNGLEVRMPSSCRNCACVTALIHAEGQAKLVALYFLPHASRLGVTGNRALPAKDS